MYFDVLLCVDIAYLQDHLLPRKGKESDKHDGSSTFLVSHVPLCLLNGAVTSAPFVAHDRKLALITSWESHGFRVWALLRLVDFDCQYCTV